MDDPGGGLQHRPGPRATRFACFRGGRRFRSADGVPATRQRPRTSDPGAMGRRSRRPTARSVLSTSEGVRCGPPQVRSAGRREPPHELPARAPRIRPAARSRVPDRRAREGAARAHPRTAVEAAIRRRPLSVGRARGGGSPDSRDGVASATARRPTQRRGPAERIRGRSRPSGPSETLAGGRGGVERSYADRRETASVPARVRNRPSPGL